jgi:hypothetical protein
VNDAAVNEEENKDEDENDSAEVSASVPRLIATDQNPLQVNLGELRIKEGIGIGIAIGVGVGSMDKKRIRDGIGIKCGCSRRVD